MVYIFTFLNMLFVQQKTFIVLYLQQHTIVSSFMFNIIYILLKLI